jgi:pyridoxal/pyridoxine/pyridoxamine kinase
MVIDPALCCPPQVITSTSGLEEGGSQDIVLLASTTLLQNNTAAQQLTLRIPRIQVSRSVKRVQAGQDRCWVWVFNESINGDQVCSSFGVALHGVYVQAYFTGTGDLMAALLLARLHERPHDLATAVELATAGLQAVLQETVAACGPAALAAERTAEVR